MWQKNKKQYPVVRNSDAVETEESLNETAYELVNVLILTEDEAKEQRRRLERQIKARTVDTSVKIDDVDWI